MIPIAFTVESNLLTKRGHGKLMADLLEETLVDHKENRLPRHFERNADTAPGGAYGYSARTAKTQRQKAKKFGHQIPLYQTGRLKEAVTSGSRITANQYRARLRAKGYFPMRVAMRMEIEVVTPFEQSEMRGLFGLKYSHYAKTKPEYQEFQRQRMRG